VIRIGIIGTGSMANGHGEAYRQMRGVTLTACCDIDRRRAETFAARHGIERVYDDYRKMLADAPLDAVSVATTDDAHAPVAIAAAKRKLHVFCEKPLATSLADARRMLAAVRKAGVVHGVNFSYRNAAGLQKAAAAIAAGRIGRVRHVESSYLQSWLAQDKWGDWRASKGWLWRLATSHGSTGVLGDIGCHIYDMTAMLAGKIARIDCTLKTFDKAPKNRIGEFVLDANDSFVSTVGFAGGAVGVVHASRWACGHLNSLRVRVFGDAGALEVDLDRSRDSYLLCAGAANLRKPRWREVRCAAAPTLYQRFIRAIRGQAAMRSDFANAVKVQAYLHHSELSDRTGRPSRVR